MSSNGDSKREIKIYKKTYSLPVLSGGSLDRLQTLIRQRNENLTQGRLVITKEEKRGLFRKEIIEHKSRQALSFEERYQELNAIVTNYDQMVSLLRIYQYDYYRFFQELAQEIIGENCNEIAAKEAKRLEKEQQESQKPNPNPQVLAMLTNMQTQLFETAKSTSYAAVLMLKKLDLMSENLRKITSDQDTQKQLLAEVLEEIRSQKDLYEMQLEINAWQRKTAQFVDIAFNFEEYMKPFMVSFQDLLSSLATVDQELSKAMNEIQNIAQLLGAQQFLSLEPDQDSHQIVDFLATGVIKTDRLQDALDQMENLRSGAQFDARIISAGKDVKIENLLSNIRQYLNLKLDSLPSVNVPAISESDHNFVIDSSLTPVVIDKRKSISIPGTNLTLELVQIPAGSFDMGSNESDAQKPIHTVNIKAFRMGKYALTQAQYQAVMGTNPSNFKGNDLPVECISWHDAKAFCQKLSEMIAQEVRLPSEAQWEYACRSGTTTHFTFGNTITSNQVNYDGNYPFDNAPKGKYRQKTVPVESFFANAWGLYQMHGNVWEWCEDVWHDNYNGAPTDGSPWTQGGNQERRLLRGGSWSLNGLYCRSASRNGIDSDVRSNNIGFRVCLL